MFTKVAHAMCCESYQDDSCFSLGNQIIEDLVNAADGEAIICRASPDEFRQRRNVAGQTIHCSHGHRDFMPLGAAIFTKRIGQNNPAQELFLNDTAPI
jgi:hypothetical protein